MPGIDQQRVAKGAALLDEKMPGWHEIVDHTDLLDRPLIVQLFPTGSSSGLIRLLADRPERDDPGRSPRGKRDPILLAPLYGFIAVGDGHNDRSVEQSLRHHWRQEIRARKNRTNTPTQED